MTWLRHWLPRHAAFIESQKKLLRTSFRVKNTHQWIKFLAKAIKQYFDGIFGLFLVKESFLKTSALSAFYS